MMGLVIRTLRDRIAIHLVCDCMQVYIMSLSCFINAQEYINVKENVNNIWYGHLHAYQ